MQKNIEKQKILFEREHWKYYLLLEKRFLKSLEYVSLNRANLACFSMEFSSLLLLIGSELDSVFKIFCGIDDESRSTIANYANYILKNNPEVVNQVIILQQYDMSIQPFKDWNNYKPSQSLVWWTAFTDIKHNRSNNLDKASLENVLNMLGALFFIEMLYLKTITENSNVMDVFGDNSDLFLLKEWTSKAIPIDKIFEYLSTIGQFPAKFDGC